MCVPCECASCVIGMYQHLLCARCPVFDVCTYVRRYVFNIIYSKYAQCMCTACVLCVKCVPCMCTVCEMCPYVCVVCEICPICVLYMPYMCVPCILCELCVPGYSVLPILTGVLPISCIILISWFQLVCRECMLLNVAYSCMCSRHVHVALGGIPNI